jgi:Tesmin/TSO1-like CXC domain, cysteine-rich domain
MRRCSFAPSSFRCLKLYCQCFASSTTCGAKCKCESCKNTPQHASEIEDARQMILDRNPAAFESHHPRHVPRHLPATPSAAPRFTMNPHGAAAPTSSAVLGGASPYEPLLGRHYGAPTAPSSHRMHHPGRSEPPYPVPPHEYRGYGTSYTTKYEGFGRRGSYDGTPYPPPPSHAPPPPPLPPSVTPGAPTASPPPPGFHHGRPTTVSHASVMLAQTAAAAAAVAASAGGGAVDSPTASSRRLNRRNCKCRRSKCLKVRK